MFEGIKKFFSGDSPESNVVPQEEGIDETAQRRLKLDSFSKIFPEVTFTDETIDRIIELAGLTQNEVENIMSLSAINESLDDSFNLDSARDRIVTASNTL